MSVPTNLLRLFSPRLSDLLDHLPCVTTSLIIPDTNINTLSVLLELLMNGKTKQDLPSLASNVTELAELLGITNFNIEAPDGTNRELEETEPVQREPGHTGEEEPEPVDPGVAELQAQLGKEKYDKLAVKAGEIRLMFKQRQVGLGT